MPVCSAMESARRCSVHIEYGCSKLRGRRRTTKSSCSSYAFVILAGAPGIGRSLSPSIPSAIQRLSQLRTVWLTRTHNFRNGRSRHALLSSQQHDLSTGTQSYIFCCSIQFLSRFQLFCCQGRYFQRLSHGVLLLLTVYLISQNIA